ncbi:hypothetical protein DPMN_183704 [Dreissena polymorpha]|uniref:Uncharacterized protein n=1 Tax=Dreissena polymorpha TaxID=45954 RepID=A0A9D4DHI4_DREPO|nr:hypothetical protein DPMN_183704 [Dreissena polymorpha]
MAERRRNRQSKTASGIDADAEKRRSRSEGPHGRRKIRNSMHETSSMAKEQYKHVSNERYSMFTGQLSDHDNLMQGDPSESESMESDMEQQKWTKNPLMVRKSRKSDRVSKTDKRRSVHNTDQIGKTVSPRERPPNMFQNPKSKDLFLYPGKCEPLPKAFKFQRMEENRKKRIDMTKWPVAKKVEDFLLNV